MAANPVPAMTPRAAIQHELSMEEFKKWLKRFDRNGDNRISVAELRSAIQATGVWFFCKRKAKRGVKIADKNFNGVIDDYEIDHLVDFAQKYLGIKITPN